MATKRIRIYNAVIAPDSAIDGMLFTDNELKRMSFFEKRDLRNGIKPARVKVYNTDVYYFFGKRFASAIKEYIAEK